MADNRELLSTAFARKIRRLRQECGWSQAEFGRQVGLGQSRMSKIEEAGNVTLDQADMLARALGIPLSVLLAGQPSVIDGIRVRRLAKIAAITEQLHKEVLTVIHGL